MHSCVLCVFATFVHINVTCVRFMFVDVTISLFSLDFHIFQKGCSAHFKIECVDRIEISDEMFLVHVLLSVLVFRGGFYIGCFIHGLQSLQLHCVLYSFILLNRIRTVITLLKPDWKSL